MDATNFVCQRCGAPIRMNTEFSSLSEITIAELSLPIFMPSKSDYGSRESVYDKSTPSFRLREVSNGNNNGFMLVNDSGEQEALSHHLRMTAELMDLMSSTSDVDHPMCQDCCESLLDVLEGELQKAETDLKEYKVLHSQLLKEEQERKLTGGRNEVNDLMKKLEEMKESEKDLLLELKKLQLDEESIDKDVAELEKEKERLVGEEEQYFKEYARYKQEALRLEDETRSVECQLRYTQSQLDKLKKTTVFSATFHIWASKQFGYINGFRLGRLPDQPVEWWEINAAWGQTALLLSAMATKRGLTFQKYRIVPYGNYSYIQILEDSRVLNLYGSGSFRTGIFSDRVFDQGMVAFLDCLQQFKADMEKSGTLRLPHAIDRDKGRIDDGAGNWYSIKIQFNSEEQWTKALRYLLVNLKWALTWVSAQILESEAAENSPS